MLRIALTGGIASGKSAAAAAFRALGVPVVDTDRIAREVVAPGQPGLAALVAAFGTGILEETGELDRSRMRERIFSDAAARRRVNLLLHPLILQRVAGELATLDAPYAIVEIPLLAESGRHTDFDRVLVIDAPKEMQVQRLQQRDDMNPAQTGAALAAQAPRAQRLAIADDVIENTGDLAALQSAVATLHVRYLEMAKRFASPQSRPAE